MSTGAAFLFAICIVIGGTLLLQALFGDAE